MALARLLFILSLVFLQEGFTYYLSFQLLGILTLAALVLPAVVAVRGGVLEVFVFLAFTVSLLITALFSPFVISTNSPNILFTTAGVLAYAAAIFCLPLLRVRHPELLLSTLRSVSSAVILLLVGILLISESKIIPLFTRETLLQQNARLIDNFTDADAIEADQAFQMLINESGRIDLFYGEPSFLAVVLFACLGCYALTSKLLSLSSRVTPTVSRRRVVAQLMELTQYSGVLILLYIQSLSSIMYAMVVIYYMFVKQNVRGKTRLATLVIVAVSGITFSMFSYDYLVYRLSMEENLSFDQRFGFIFELSLMDVLIGIKDVAMLPEAGIHNGFLYIIAVSGVGGLFYLLVLLRSSYSLAAPIRLAMFAVLLVLAIVMQNGGVFSPNKVLLFSLVLLPLACSRTIGMAQSSAQPAGIFHD